MFGSIMKRLQMATERICETECEMKTLKEWKVDLTYKQPQIKVFEMKQTKQHMPITIMEKEGTFEDTKNMAVKCIVLWMQAQGFKEMLNVDKFEELIEGYSIIKLFTSKGREMRKHKVEIWRDTECTQTFSFGHRNDNSCAQGGKETFEDNAGRCKYCKEVCHYGCQCPLEECTEADEHCEGCCPHTHLTMQVVDAAYATGHPQEGESRLFLNKFLKRFSPKWERIFRSEQSTDDDEMQTSQSVKKKSTSSNGGEAIKYGFKKKQEDELDEEQQRAEEIEMEEKLRKAMESDQG